MARGTPSSTITAWSLCWSASTGSLGTMPHPSSLATVATFAPHPTVVPSLPHAIMASAPATVATSLVSQTSTPPSALFPMPYAAMPTVTPSSGLLLSPASEPIPARLVSRISSGQFVEMRDLLSDNIALHDKLESFHGSYGLAALPHPLRPRVREVPSLISWVYCFAAYAAVRTTDPQTRDMLAYCRILVREALRHGGGGWLEYDRNFRRQLAINPALRWNSLLPDLQATTILGQRAGSGCFCYLCSGMDHTPSQCALQAFAQPTLPTTTTEAPPVGTRRPPPGRTAIPPRPETLLRICASWNMGQCAYPATCTFKHICTTCHLTHRARDCPDTPADSPYKRRRKTPTAVPPATTTAAH